MANIAWSGQNQKQGRCSISFFVWSSLHYLDGATDHHVHPSPQIICLCPQSVRPRAPAFRINSMAETFNLLGCPFLFCIVPHRLAPSSACEIFFASRRPQWALRLSHFYSVEFHFSRKVYISFATCPSREACCTLNSTAGH